MSGARTTGPETGIAQPPADGPALGGGGGEGVCEERR